jgi:hypothetical protein
MSTVAVVQHIACEPLGIIEAALAARRVEAQYIEAGIDGMDIRHGIDSHLPRMQEIGTQVFSRWCGLISE